MQILIPTTTPGDWKRLLARETHWKVGRSAMTLAKCWEEFKLEGGPPEVLRMLPSAQFFMALPEYKVPLPPAGGRPSQTDLFVLGRDADGLIAVSVEGKVDEPFGPTLEERRADPSGGVQERINYLLSTLQLPEAIPGQIRYQLLHRSVAALLSARKFGARRAFMLVHSFSEVDAWYEDFAAFAALFGVTVEPGKACLLGEFDGIRLEAGWCRGDQRFRTTHVIMVGSIEPRDALGGYHILTFAETGFAMLSIYGREFGMENSRLQDCADKANDEDRCETLHPMAPISVVPRKYIRDLDNADLLSAQIREFLAMNKARIGASRLLIDFRAGVAPFVLQGVQMALASADADVFEHVTVVGSNAQ